MLFFVRSLCSLGLVVGDTQLNHGVSDNTETAQRKPSASRLPESNSFRIEPIDGAGKRKRLWTKILLVDHAVAGNRANVRVIATRYHVNCCGHRVFKISGFNFNPRTIADPLTCVAQFAHPA